MIAPSPIPRFHCILKDATVGFTRTELDLSEINAVSLLGTGTFSKVLLVRRDAQSGPQFYAMKVLRKKDIVRLQQVDHVNSEIYILSHVKHPFIVELQATFHDSLYIYMLMSYIPGGELFGYLRQARRFSTNTARFYLSAIVLALKYLHSLGIVYRDLKPENLVLDSRGYLCLIDFGFAKTIDAEDTRTLCGTPEYLSPEIILSGGHGKPVDWWACGVIGYEMMVGHPPFVDEVLYNTYMKILTGDIFWPEYMDVLSKDLIQSFLNPDQTKRLGSNNAQEVLDHPWFSEICWEALERRDLHAPIIPQTSVIDYFIQSHDGFTQL